ncbi:flavin monoamine oxidase family protein [Arvimicrobium flavum]|uniref:flavin monoamine oxidase family protein n=1 Tax=Arvimicrobium flavum TaxID=3393320 RepID=UPI00237A7BFB|nr:FAD-dependent oxidoreductase [Mesorhizobium shangrilense]
MSGQNVDVAVIGAGFAGLAAALELQQSGVDFILLEARDRAGGRVEARRNGLGELIDTGGQFLCEDMPELMALVRRSGLTLVTTPVAGAFTVQPPMSGVAAERSYAASMAIRDRMNLIDPKDPAIAGLSVADWLARQDVSADARSGFQSMIEGLWCQPIERIPLWYLIDNDRRVTNEIPELQYFVGETMQALADRLASALGERLRLSTAVTSVGTGSRGVRINCSGTVLHARRALVAVPPVAARQIRFQPPLPDRLQQALDAWNSGTVIKGLVRYATPFWRTLGRNGMVMWRDIHGLFACDASHDDGHPALVVFIAGPLAERWRGLGGERLAMEIRSRLAAALGPEADQVLDITFRDWCGDRWSGGGYSDIIVDAATTDAEDVLREGAWPILFTCSELSPSFPGYVEGAIVAGRAAARRLLDETSTTGR